MTVAVPTVPPAPQRPAGDPAGASAWADGLRLAASLCDERGEWIGGEAVAMVGRDDGWTGAAAAAYRSSTYRPQVAAQSAATALRTVATAVYAYADALATLRGQADDLTERRANLADRASDLRALARGADPEDLALAQSLARSAAGLRWEVDAYARAVSALTADTRAAEQALLDALARYPDLATAQSALAATSGNDPAVASALVKAGGLPTGLSPDEARDWWAGLTDAERDAMVVEHPEIIGSLDGLPADARDTANRLLLDRDIETLEAREEAVGLDVDERAALANARTVRDQLASFVGQRDPLTREPLVAQLYDYEPGAFGGDGRALVSLGDLTTADNVAFFVPGLTTTVGSLGTNLTAMNELYQESRYADANASTACMVWIGYDAPSDLDSLTVATEGRARAGGAMLADDVAGFLASRGADEPNLTVIGHSYGSTTVAHGATGTGMDADSIVLLGSPGAGNNVDHASDLGIGAENVYVGSANSDPVSWLGGHGWVNLETLPGDLGLGNDPAEDDFGAHRFQAEVADETMWHVPTTYPPGAAAADWVIRALDDHTSYFRENSESLYNVAAIVTGHEDQILTAEHRTDPWYGSVQDPEGDRDATHQSHQGTP